MLEELLAAWRTHEAINRYLVEHTPEVGLAAIPLLKNGQPGKGRNVARQLAHLIEVRASRRCSRDWWARASLRAAAAR